MEIEVNDYVRTKTGYIGKLHKISTYKINDKDKTMYLVDFGNITYAISYKDIVKHSPNIIDLIEVGDYVNGKKIDAILDSGFKSEGVAERVLCFEIDFPIEKGLRAYHNYDIKSIVTKEMFASAEYRVETD